MEKIHIAIVAQNDLVRSGLQMLLARPNAGIQIDGAFMTLYDYERFVKTADVPQILILDDKDLILPHRAIKQIRQAAPYLKIIILSEILGEQYIQVLFDAGALGFVYKNDHLEESIIAGIRVVLSGNFYLSPKASALPYARCSDALNQTDIAVVELMAQGYTVTEISARLNLVSRTVYRIRRKLRDYLLVRTNEQIVEAAKQQGLLAS